MPSGPEHRDTVAALLQRAAEGLQGRRGGDAVLTTWLQGDAPTEALSTLERAIEPSVLHVGIAEKRSGLALAWVGAEAGCFAVWVEPEARHAGLGPERARAAIDWLDAQGVTEIDSLALPGDREMKNVLEKAGFKARLLTLRRSG